MNWQERIARLRDVLDRLADDGDMPTWARDECRWALQDDERLEQQMLSDMETERK